MRNLGEVQDCTMIGGVMLLSEDPFYSIPLSPPNATSRDCIAACLLYGVFFHSPVVSDHLLTTLHSIFRLCGGALYLQTAAVVGDVDVEAGDILGRRRDLRAGIPLKHLLVEPLRQLAPVGIVDHKRS